MRKKILCLENLPFNSYIKVGSHHYAENFSKEYEVLWISLPWHIPQLIKYPANERFKNWNFGKPKKINDNLYAISPFTLIPYRNNPVLSSDFILYNFYYFFFPSVINYIKKLGFENVDLVWFSDPRHISLLKFIKYKKLAYRCVDNLEHFLDVPSKLIKTEISLIKKCDAVFFTSKELEEKFSIYNSRSYYLPNGVDFDFFNKPKRLNNDCKVYNFLSEEKDKNIVYMGAIAEWFDFEVLEKLSEKYSNHNFLIIGPQRVNSPDKLKNRNNIYFSGPLSYEKLPCILQKCSIGLIPFLVNEVTDFVNPIKMFEYLSAGLVVFCSNIKTVAQMKAPVVIYEEKTLINDFNNALKKAKDNNFILNGIKYAKTNSWQKKTKFIYEKVGI